MPNDTFENKEDAEAQAAIAVRAKLIGDLEAAGQSTEASQTVADIYSRYLYVASKQFGTTVDELHNMSVQSAGGYDASNPEDYLGKARYMEPGSGSPGGTDLKQRQFEIIQRTNPMTDDYHTGIRSAEEIKSLEETLDDPESFSYPDFTLEQAKAAVAEDKVTVYSSKPIAEGVFVSPSRQAAQDYAGPNGKVYSADISPREVAWINGDEGMYAKVMDEYERRLDEDESEWKKNAGKIVDENDPSRATGQIRVMNTPLVLSLVSGSKEVLPLYIKQAKILEIQREHNLSKEQVMQIPRALADPIAIFKPIKESLTGKRFDFMTEIKDQSGSTVIAFIEINIEDRELKFNRLDTYFGKDDGSKENPKPRNEWYVDQVNQGRLLYVNKDKARDWADTLGLQLLTDRALRELDEGNIPDESDLVKARAERNNVFYQGMGNGYSGYSMSNNAIAAYENGEKPKSKWSKADILEAVAAIDKDKAELLKDVNVSVLRSLALYNSSWHHTSSMYNRTEFYAIDEDFVKNLTPERAKEQCR